MKHRLSDTNRKLADINRRNLEESSLLDDPEVAADIGYFWPPVDDQTIQRIADTLEEDASGATFSREIPTGLIKRIKDLERSQPDNFK